MSENERGMEIRCIQKKKNCGHEWQRTIYQNHITLINVYAPNQGGPKYIEQLVTELKGETHKNTIPVGDLNTLLTALARSS